MTRFALVAALLSLGVATAQAADTGKSCRAVQFSGAVERGKDFVQPIGNHLVFRLRAIPSGWRIEVVADNMPAVSHDLAELATPPYLSPTPLLLSTDYSFRAQDAVGWTPRRFRFLTGVADQRQLSGELDALANNPQNSQAAEELLRATKRSVAGELVITGANLEPGSADIAGTAAGVTSHLNAVNAVSGSGPPSKLGRIESVAFTVTLAAEPATSKAGKSIRVACE